VADGSITCTDTDRNGRFGYGFGFSGRQQRYIMVIFSAAKSSSRGAAESWDQKKPKAKSPRKKK
jgi:hypothetical protein